MEAPLQSEKSGEIDSEAEKMELDPGALTWRNLNWELIPPDSRERVIPFLSVQDNMKGLNNAMTTKKDQLREELVASYKQIIPAWHKFPFNNKSDFKDLHKALEMGIDLQTVNLTVNPRWREESTHPDRVLDYLVTRKQRKLAELYATKWSAFKNKKVPLGDGQNEDEDEGEDDDNHKTDAGVVHETLGSASSEGYVVVVRALLKRGADVNKVSNGLTPLFNASKMGRVDVVKVLLEHGADIDKTCDRGNTPFLIASRNGHLEVVKVLLEAVLASRGKYDLDLYINKARESGNSAFGPPPAGSVGQTALYLASFYGHVDVLQFLMLHGASTKQVAGLRSPVRVAVSNGHPKVVRALVEGGEDLSVVHDSGPTHLSVATSVSPCCAEKQREYLETVEILIKGGAEIDRADTDGAGATPLLNAAKRGNVEVVRVLLAAGATVDRALNNSGVTALFLACSYGNVELVKILLESGAALDRPNNAIETPLYAAAEKGFVEVVRLLLEKGRADANADGDGDADGVVTGVDVAPIGHGKTPLFVATEKGFVQVAKLLVEIGGADTSVSVNGKTLEQVAKRLDIIVLLRRVAWDRRRSARGASHAGHAYGTRSRTGGQDATAVLADTNADTNADASGRELEEEALLDRHYDYYFPPNAQTLDVVEPGSGAPAASEFRCVHWYMAYQGELNARMREILVDWMTEVVTATSGNQHGIHPMKLTDETRSVLCQAVKLMDRHLSRVVTPRSQLQLVGFVAMKVAYKAFMDFVDLCHARAMGGLHSMDEILAMESSMLSALEWNVYWLPPTAQDCLHEYLLAMDAVDTTLAHLAYYYAERNMHFIDIWLAHPPQHLAAAALFAASVWQCQHPNLVESYALFLARCTRHSTAVALLQVCWVEKLRSHTGLRSDSDIAMLVTLASEMATNSERTTTTRDGRALDACKKKYGDWHPNFRTPTEGGEGALKGVSQYPLPDFSALLAFANSCKIEEGQNRRDGSGAALTH